MVPIGGALAGLCRARRSFRGTVGRSCSRSAASRRSSSRSSRCSGCPKSIKFMTLHESHRPKMERLIAAIRPDFKVPPNARFVIEDEKQFPSSNPRYLFRNGLQADHAADLADLHLQPDGLFLPLCWTPTILVSAAKASQTVAALTGAGLQVGGTIGALVLCWWLQRQRFLAIAILFLIAVPVVAAIGYAGLSSTAALLFVAFLAGAVVLGIQSGINVVGAMIYPTSLRANGSGWQLRLGRFGAIIGPLAGTMLVGVFPYPAPLPVRGDSVRARRSGDLHHLRAQQRAAEGASGACAGAITIVIPGLRPVAASRKDVRTARTLAAPGSPSRRTAGSSASDRPPAGRRN